MSVGYKQIDNYHDLEKLYGAIFVLQYKLFTTTILRVLVRPFAWIHSYFFCESGENDDIILPVVDGNRMIDRFARIVIHRDVRIIRCWKRIQYDLENNTIVHTRTSYCGLIDQLLCKNIYLTISLCCISLVLITILAFYLTHYLHQRSLIGSRMEL